MSDQAQRGYESLLSSNHHGGSSEQCGPPWSAVPAPFRDAWEDSAIAVGAGGGGCAAYEAHAANLGGAADWDKLAPDAQAAWESAAQAMR